MYDIDFKSKSELLELVKSHSNKEFIIIPSAKYNPTSDYGYLGGFIKLEDNKFNLYCTMMFTHEVICVEIAEDELPDSGHFLTEFEK